MPSADLLIPFLVASAIFACVPGPGMLYAAAQTLALGRRAGWRSALGFHLAGLGHIIAAALGVSAVLAVVPALYTAMKLAGAAYLIWLGASYLRRPNPPASTWATIPHTSDARALRDSIIVEALNPKSALFFLAFLPQFTDPTAVWPVWAQVLVLGSIVNAMFSLTDILLVVAADTVGRTARSSTRLLAAMRRAGGGILIALGLHIAFAKP